LREAIWDTHYPLHAVARFPARHQKISAENFTELSVTENRSLPVWLEEIRLLSPAQALEQARAQFWYHSIDIVPEFSSVGVFDLRTVCKDYGLPTDLSGQSVLDIGRSSGFFAFEFEKRNADVVVATELPSLTDKNFIGGDITADLVSRWLSWEKRDGWQNVAANGRRLDFYLAHKLRNSSVVPVDCRIEDVTTLGSFDMVFVGSLLNHVRDIGGALQAVRKATKDLCVIANPIIEDDSTEPRIMFNGLRTTGLTTWFVPNVAALVHLVESAGFVDVKVHNPRLALPFKSGTMPHAIIHAHRGSEADAQMKIAKALSDAYPGIDEMLKERLV